MRPRKDWRESTSQKTMESVNSTSLLLSAEKLTHFSVRGSTSDRKTGFKRTKTEPAGSGALTIKLRQIPQTLGMMGAWSFLCLKPSQLKPSNHLKTKVRCSRFDESALTSGGVQSKDEVKANYLACYLLVFHNVSKTALLVAESLSGVISEETKWNVIARLEQCSLVS